MTSRSRRFTFALICFLTLPFGAVRAEPSDESPAALPVSVKTEVVQGTLVHRPWSKSMESFAAGGSDYFAVERGQHGEGPRVVVLPSDQVPRERLLALVGKRIELKGERVAPRPFVPEPGAQYPVGMDGQPAVKAVGGGLRALSVKPLAAKRGAGGKAVPRSPAR